MDTQSQDELNGIRFIWNSFPSSRQDMSKIVIPVGFHYTPCQSNENMDIITYSPLSCPKCHSIISPIFSYSIRAKIWECPFCNTKVHFPKAYSDVMTETQLPSELFPENSTIEYILNRKEANYPIFLFVLDIGIDEEELNELKDSIQQTINELPPECYVGIITYGRMCNIHEIGNTEMPVSYALNGEKAYQSNEILEQLGLSKGIKYEQQKFIVPVGEVAFNLNSFLDDLQTDSWSKKHGERAPNCVGLAINTAISMLEVLSRGEPARVMVFMGGPGTIGEGMIVSKELKEQIRSFVDFDSGNSNTYHYKSASDFYNKLAINACTHNIIIDIFSCCLNQVGLYEMKNLVQKTGGYIIFTDSFSTMIFKDSMKKIFSLDDKGNLKMCFKAKIEFNCTSNVKMSGALGHMHSIKEKTPIVSDIEMGEGGTRSWLLGGIDNNSTYTFILDCNNTSESQKVKNTAIIQLITTYIAGDRTTRMRVTTVEKKIIYDLSKEQGMNEIGNSFDQEAAAVLITRMCIDKSLNGEEMKDIIKWLDKSLIRLMARFSKYNKDDPKSFRLTQSFNFFPQLMFYLRRSSFVQCFNESPDENTYFRFELMFENVSNCTIMIQPILYEYSVEELGKPVLLDLDSMKNECVLLLDTFFYVVVWHGIEVCKWREEGFQDQEGYEYIKSMLDQPQDYAQNIVIERLPTPRFISCDSGSGQERLIKCIVNPSQESKNRVKENGFFSDDVNIKVFMDYLQKLAVSS